MDERGASGSPSSGGVLIVGRGRVGMTLFAALERCGMEVEIVAGGEDLAATLQARHKLMLLAVPDAAVAHVAERVAATAEPVALRAPMFAHLSGALDLVPLTALRERGYAVGSLHPLCAVPNVLPPEALDGITFALDASEPRLLSTLEALARALGGRPRKVGGEERALYHAAAVTASNHLVTLLDDAVAMLGAIGWSGEEALAALLPLVRGTVENVAAAGLPHALSGPVRRGDAGTIATHIAALSADPELAHAHELYVRLGESTVRLARALELSEPQAAAVLSALEGKG